MSQPAKILLIEDDPGIAASVGRVCRRKGMKLPSNSVATMDWRERPKVPSISSSLISGSPGFPAWN